MPRRQMGVRSTRTSRQNTRISQDSKPFAEKSLNGSEQSEQEETQRWYLALVCRLCRRLVAPLHLYRRLDRYVT